VLQEAREQLAVDLHVPPSFLFRVGWKLVPTPPSRAYRPGMQVARTFLA